MDRLERFYRIDQLLQERDTVPRQRFLDELEVSHATFKRDLEYMRDRFIAPIVWDADAEGYRYGKSDPGPRFALPGLWFSEREAFALVMMEHLLSSLGQGGADRPAHRAATLTIDPPSSGRGKHQPTKCASACACSRSRRASSC